MSYTIPFTDFTIPTLTTVTVTGIPGTYSYIELGLRHPATGNWAAWGWTGVTGSSATMILFYENTGGPFNTSGIFNATLWAEFHDGHNWHWREYQASSISITAGVDNTIPFAVFSPMPVPTPPTPTPPPPDPWAFRENSERPGLEIHGRSSLRSLRVHQ